MDILGVIAFVAHQYYCLQDNLVDTLLTTVQSNQNACLKEIKDPNFDGRRKRNDLLADLLEALDSAVFRAAQIAHGFAGLTIGLQGLSEQSLRTRPDAI